LRVDGLDQVSGALGPGRQVGEYRQIPLPAQRREPVYQILRHLAIGIFKLAGHPSTAATCCGHARDATRTLPILGLSPA
jgi:hypothetical protein